MVWGNKIIRHCVCHWIGYLVNVEQLVCSLLAGWPVEGCSTNPTLAECVTAQTTRNGTKYWHPAQRTRAAIKLTCLLYRTAGDLVFLHELGLPRIPSSLSYISAWITLHSLSTAGVTSNLHFTTRALTKQSQRCYSLCIFVEKPCSHSTYCIFVFRLWCLTHSRSCFLVL